MTRYSLKVTRTFEKNLRLLNKIQRVRIDEAVTNLEEDPHLGKPLKGPLSGRWSLRVGDYRVIYIVDDVGLSVTLLDVQHRRTVYR
ncbi:MAG: type II toxin-antitoxin system RelE/ParE family toxin [Candidatus Bathyarchaeota archaeon]